MARMIRFPLIMKNGAEVRNLEDLRENADIESMIKYYLDGRLYRWLTAFGYEEEATKIATLDEETCKKLFEVLCLEYNDEQLSKIDIDKIKSESVEQVKQEEFPELEKAKKITSESEIIDVVLEHEVINTNLVPATSKYKEKGKDNIFGFLTDDEYDIISNITINICNHDSKLKSSSIYAVINEIIDSGVPLLDFYLKWNSEFTILDDMKGIVDGTRSVNPEYDKIIVEKIYPYFCNYFSN